MHGKNRAAGTAPGGLARRFRVAAPRRPAVVLVLVLLAGCASGCASGSASARPVPAGGPHCQAERIPVRLSATALVTYHIAGWLCADGPLRGRAVEVLIPGLTYGAA